MSVIPVWQMNMKSNKSDLCKRSKKMKKTLIELQKRTIDMKMLYQGLVEFSEIKELTPTIVNKLIERIEIHNNEKKHSHNNIKVDIYSTAVGLFDVPTRATVYLYNGKGKTEKCGKIRLNKKV